MTKTTTRLTAAVETYLADLQRVRASGGATGERPSYGPLSNLLNAIGATLKPKVFCVGELADQGAGHPESAALDRVDCYAFFARFNEGEAVTYSGKSRLGCTDRRTGQAGGDRARVRL